MEFLWGFNEILSKKQVALDLADTWSLPFLSFPSILPAPHQVHLSVKTINNFAPWVDWLMTQIQAWNRYALGYSWLEISPLRFFQYAFHRKRCLIRMKEHIVLSEVMGVPGFVGCDNPTCVWWKSLASNGSTQMALEGSPKFQPQHSVKLTVSYHPSMIWSPIVVSLIPSHCLRNFTPSLRHPFHLWRVLF